MSERREADTIVKGIQRNPDLRKWFGPHQGEDAADHFWQHSAYLRGEEVEFTEGGLLRGNRAKRPPTLEAPEVLRQLVARRGA